MAQKNKRSRGFAITDFVLDEEFWTNYMHKTRYGVCGVETAPETGRVHWQMYIYLENGRSLESMIKDLNPRHVEVARGTPEQNIAYCKKDGKFTEWGTPPEQGKRKDLDEIKEKLILGTKQEEISLAHFSKWIQYGRRFEEFRTLHEPKRTWVTEVYILHGEPETGKTRYVMEKHETIATLTLSGDIEEPFVNGYNGEDVVLFDEFKPMKASKEWMLRALDRYPMNINIKGGTRNWKPRIIYFTTNSDPTEWYNGDRAFLRRITKFMKFPLIEEPKPDESQ